MFWLYLTTAIVVGLILFSLALYWLIRWLGKREPHGAFLRLTYPTEANLLSAAAAGPEAADTSVRKADPCCSGGISLHFVPVLGYLDDMALALLALVMIIKLTPRPVVLHLLCQAREVKPLPTEGEGSEREISLL